MSGLVIRVSDRQGVYAMYTALLGGPHTGESSYVGHDIDGFEVALHPAGHPGGPVTFADAEDLDALHDSLLAASTTERDARVRSRQRRGSACSPAGTAHPSMCVEGGSPVTLARRRLAPDCAWERTALNVE
ncbi:hypothetical protein ACXR8F_09215 [Terrabacter sp. AAH1]